jgi:predicted unusual protein kinase regulating ubiquinone biosynthesis (AarF/ABC1/UbiB family)
LRGAEAGVSDKEDTKSVHVPTGRLARLGKMGGTATTATARVAMQKLREVVSSQSEKVQQRRDMRARTAKDVADTLAEMKGAAMKVGQLLSMDPQILPPEVRDALKVLQKSAPPMPFDMVRSVISSAFGRPLDEVFGRFEEEPMGAASLGQVHEAVGLAGQALAVKVQYPGIADTIDSDIRNLGAVLQLTRVVLPGVRIDDYLDELRVVLHQEADYLQEADALERYAQILQAMPYARVPKPFKELTRKTVLSMELIEGHKFDEHLVTLPPHERDLLASRFLELYMRLFHELYCLHADPHPGNFLVDKEGRIVLLDFGCVKEFDPAFVDGMTDIMRAHWQGDAEALPGIYSRCGFSMPEGKVPDGDALYEWHEIVLEPFLRDAPFDFSQWKLEQKARPFIKENLKLLNMHPPRQAMLYFRVCAGVRGMLTRTGAQVNVYRLAKAMELRLNKRKR